MGIYLDRVIFHSINTPFPFPFPPQVRMRRFLCLPGSVISMTACCSGRALTRASCLGRRSSSGPSRATLSIPSSPNTTWSASRELSSSVTKWQRSSREPPCSRNAPTYSSTLWPSPCHWSTIRRVWHFLLFSKQQQQKKKKKKKKSSESESVFTEKGKKRKC